MNLYVDGVEKEIGNIEADFKLERGIYFRYYPKSRSVTVKYYELTYHDQIKRITINELEDGGYSFGVNGFLFDIDETSANRIKSALIKKNHSLDDLKDCSIWQLAVAK